MIMDDHEIRDDWGDKEEDADSSTDEHFIARCGFRVFCEYQAQLFAPVDLVHPTNFLKSKQHRIFALNGLGICLADMRAARTFHPAEKDPAIMLGSEQWADIEAALSQGGALAQADTLIFGAGVPLCFYNKAISDIVGSTASKVDDILGHWAHSTHQPEQLRVMQTLNKWKKAKRGRELVVLGGDVHVGGFTSLKKKGKMLGLQFFCSSIGNTRFSPAVEIGIRMMGGDLGMASLLSDEEVNEDFTFRHHTWVADRNYGIVEIVPAEESDRAYFGGDKRQRCWCRLVRSDEDGKIHEGNKFEWFKAKSEGTGCCALM